MGPKGREWKSPLRKLVLGSGLVGAQAGAETLGRPPAGLVHDLPGVESAPPECGLLTRVSAPGSRLREGERREGEDRGLREGNGDVARLRTAGSGEAAEAPGRLEVRLR